MSCPPSLIQGSLSERRWSKGSHQRAAAEPQQPAQATYVTSMSMFLRSAFTTMHAPQERSQARNLVSAALEPSIRSTCVFKHDASSGRRVARESGCRRVTPCCSYSLIAVVAILTTCHHHCHSKHEFGTTRKPTGYHFEAIAYASCRSNASCLYASSATLRLHRG